MKKVSRPIAESLRGEDVGIVEYYFGSYQAVFFGRFCPESYDGKIFS